MIICLLHIMSKYIGMVYQDNVSEWGDMFIRGLLLQ